MSRVLLLGDTGDGGFAALRTRHFAAVLPGASVLDWRESVTDRAVQLSPDVVVTAGNHGPTRAAMRVLDALAAAGLPEPAFWLDVAGDPFAEAQAAAHATGAVAAEVAAEAQLVWGAAYARADAFSSVCEPGRSALLGALGLLGRLPLFRPGEEACSVIPCATDFPDEPGPARPPGLRVALLGGFNTWFDDTTLLAGLLLAMDRGPVEVRVFGGAIPGHTTEGYARFTAGAAASRHAARFRFHPWVPHSTLAEHLADCHVSVCLDRAGPEAGLGARTRVLYALHRGLRVLATPGSPIVGELVDAGLVEPLPAAHVVGDAAAAEALAAALLRPVGAPPKGARRAWMADRTADRLGTPLRSWALSPARLPPAPAATVLAGALAERDRALAELQRHRATPTFRLMAGLHGLVKRG